MLISFTVGNFKSINEPQTLSMTTGRVRSKNEHLYKSKGMSLLRFSAIYGSNASGKSNYIDAMDFAQTLILQGTPKGCGKLYNRTNKENLNVPTLFVFVVNIHNKIYTYGIKILLNSNSICAEWLYESSHQNRDKIIFERDLTDNHFILNDSLMKSQAAERLRIYFDDTKEIDTVLFLREMNRNKEEIYRQEEKLNLFKDIFNWFKDILDINHPDRPVSNFSYFTAAKESEEVERTLKYFGQGIVDFEIVEADREEYSQTIPIGLLEDVQNHFEKEVAQAQKTGKQIESASGMIRGENHLYIVEIDNNLKMHVKTIRFSHGQAGKYDISEESDGTRRILELIEILFSKNRNKVYVIDEIDRSLHPLMTKEFIDYYLRTLEDKNIQLIVTTHELRLLDLNMLRRDEIWFIDKDKSGNSTLYSLEQYNERFDTRVDKAYLNGRYSAIPKFGVDE